MRFTPRWLAASAARRPATRRARLHALPLERRDVPATFVVTSTLGSANSLNTPGTIRWALVQANANPATADTITFDPTVFAAPQTITLDTSLGVSGPVVIAGPTVGVTLTTTAADRLLGIGGSGKFAVAVSDVTFVGGKTSSYGGGAVYNAADSATFTRCSFINNTTTGNVGGGAILAAGRSITVVSCTFTGNSATYNSGGAIGVRGGAADSPNAITITASTFTANSAGRYGGALANDGGPTVSYSSVAVAGSTFTGNKAFSDGGAIDFLLGPSLTISDSAFVGNQSTYGSGGAFDVYSTATTVTVTNSTLAQNKADSGGAVRLYQGSPLVLRNSTVVGNVATGAGGGGAFYLGSVNGDPMPPPITVVSSVVGDNKSPTGNDFDRQSGGAISVEATYSAFGAGTNLVVSPSPTNVPLGTPLRLSPQLDTTGTRPAVVPLLDSPLVNAGINPLGLTTDGRGNARQLGPRVDIGAAERTPGPAAITVVLPTITSPVPTAAISVTFADDETGVLLADSLAGNTAAVSVTGPAGAAVVTAATLNDPTDGSPRKVEYTLAAPGGGPWDGAAFGTYTVAVVPNQVYNTASTAGPAATLGTFTVRYAQTFAVTNTLDDGSPGSLRWAVARANEATLTADTIAVAPGLTGVIALASQLVLTDSVTVTGAGAGVTVTGVNGVFNVAGSAVVTLADLTIRGATAAAGAAVVVGNRTTATLSRLVISDCTTGAVAGAGAVLSAGTLTVSDCTFTNNVALGTASQGGALATSQPATVVRSVFEGNVAAYGGAIAAGLPGITVEGSLFRGNAARNDGGAIHNGATLYGEGGVYGGVLTLRNSTVVGNTAGSDSIDGRGGGVHLMFASYGLRLENSTVVGNAALGAGGQGGGVFADQVESSTGVRVESSVLAANAAAGGGPDLITVASGYPSPVFLINSLIGVGDSWTTTTSETASLKGTLANPLDPQLGPLQNNGGQMLSRAPLAGSPLINAGSNTASLVNDQRGVGYARVYGPAADIGAVEVQPPPLPDALPPYATLTDAPTVSYRLQTMTAVRVSLADNFGVNPATVQTADFTVTGPNGFAATATSLSLSGTNPLTARLWFTAPGGTWTADDNGTYTVSLTGSVLDVNGLTAATGALGTFAVAVPVGVVGIVAALPDGTTTSLTVAGQRSRIPAIRVLFDGPATGADAAAAYRLAVNGGAVSFTVTVATVNGRTQATLTPVTPLADGKYTFGIRYDAITTPTAGGAQLDGNNDGVAGGMSSAVTFTRYLGDFDGDTAVDGNDLAILGPAFNSVVGDANYRAYLDLDGDGAIDGNDLAILAPRFNTVL